VRRKHYITLIFKYIGVFSFGDIKMKKVIFKKDSSTGYLIVELVYLQVIIMRLKDFGYRDIQVY
jgi:hypothetical protein